MAKGNFGAWFGTHSEVPDDRDVTHVTQVTEAGGFMYLVCHTCQVRQTMDEVEAGLPVVVKGA